jgi:class 3 adenylate cyclase
MPAEKAMLAVLFADVSDSTSLYEKMGDKAAFAQVKECVQILNAVTRKFRGWVIKTIGDGVMCAFSSADSAAQAACEMQLRIAQRPTSQGKHKIAIRIGFHYGNVLREGQDVYGDTVNIAARMAALCTGGHITMTGSTAAQLSLQLNSRLRRLTALPVKGKEHAIDVHEMSWQDSGQDTHVPGRAGSLGRLVESRLRIEYQHRKYIFRDTLALGRADTNDIVINDPMASRIHARIEKRRDQFALVDQSSNGTYVTITGRTEIALRRSEFVLYGDGQIAFGDSPNDRPDVATVRFVCEPAEIIQSA